MYKADPNTLGNHDITLDQKFYSEHGSHFHNQYPQVSQACIDLVQTYDSITFLNHDSAHIHLTKEDGPQTSFHVFGSPYSPANGLWAFGYPPEDASKIWDYSIPMNTDVIVTHTPPKYHCDESKDRGAAGCVILREKLWRVRPHLAICGHVHEGRGAEIVLWDLETPNTRYKEALIEYWTDPSTDNKKQSLIDLSAKSSKPLENTGSWGDEEIPSISIEELTTKLDSTSLRRWKSKERPAFTLKTLDDGHRSSYYEGIRGHGGIPPSGRCDMEALAGRMGRKETCIINAAITAASWPYKPNNQRRYNKPIVVDIDLPVLQKQGNLQEERDR